VKFTAINSAHKRRVPNQLEPFPTTKELNDLFQSQNNICGICFLPFRTFQLDHIFQIQHGGLHILSNLRFTHPWCNLTRPKRPLPMVTVLQIHEDTGEYTDAQLW
jgi:5-methylcytosine-specific restriction endonuclease McrA